jgi:Heavy metal binding domain
VRVLAGLATLFLLGGVRAQEVVYVCPMDPDIRSSQPGVCSRCGMRLLAGIPDPAEYLMDVAVKPQAPKPRETAKLEFTVRDPWKNHQVKNFQLVHERLFHLFVVSQDLQFFIHGHPILGPGGIFRFDIAFPEPGMYRVLGDFYPDGASPQLVVESIVVPGAAPPPIQLGADYSTKDAENMQVELVTAPPRPIAGVKTLMFFRLKPDDGLEPYLGAWGHMLAASDDLIDLMHSHPFLGGGGPQVQFNMIFPRARTYRIWVQFQRKGVVNTAHFDVPVHALE